MMIIPMGSKIGGDSGESYWGTLDTVATQYVTTSGDNTNDGLTWGTAKATVQAAVNALPTVNGIQVGIVEVGYGTFSSSDAITISSTQVPWIRGRGMGQSYDPTNNLTSPQHATILKNTGTGNAISIIGPDNYGPSGGTAPYGVVISDLAIIGNSSSDAGVFVQNTSFPTFNNVVFDQHGVWGQWFQTCYGALMNNCFTTRCGTSGSETACGGMFLDTTDGQIDGLVFVNCEWFECYGFGVYDQGGTDIVYVAPDFEQTKASSFSGSGQGFYGNDGTYTFMGGWFEHNAEYGCYLSGGSCLAVFNGGVFFGDSDQVGGIYADGDAITVLNATFSGHTSNYSIDNTNETFITWSGCISSDTDGFIDNGSSGVTSAASGLAFGSYGAVIGGVNAQSGSGTISFDASYGDIQAQTLTGNVSSSSVINPSPGQVITVAWIQNATGGYTYSWPTNCKFAGGSAPAPSSTAGYQDNVTFWFDGTDWREIGRAVGVH